MRAERNVWDTTKMAGLVENQKGHVDRLTYRKYLALDSDQQFRQASGSWEHPEAFSRVWRTDNLGTTEVVWAFQKPADWIRGTTLAYAWIQGEENTPTYSGNVSVQIAIFIARINEDAGWSPDYYQLMNVGPLVEIATAYPEDLLTRYEFVGISDVSHGDDGIMLVRLKRQASGSDDYLYFYGVELIHYPTLER